MPLRLIEIIVKDSGKDRVLAELEQSFSENDKLLYWLSDDEGGTLSARILTDVKESAELMDRLEKRFLSDNGYRVVVYPVQATLPRLTTPEEPDEEERKRSEARVSREELYTSVMDQAVFTWRFLILAILSAIVASIGLWRDNTAVIIGAMVIAPLLGPNLGLALSTTLADGPLLKHSARTLGAGLAAGLVVGAALGVLLPVDPASPELASRTVVGLSDIALALAAGAAGILSLSSGASMALVGVMVALALMPPLAGAGLLLGAGHYPQAMGAGLLTLANLICLNLAGMAVFVLRGVRPLRWSEKRHARNATIKATALWLALLAALVGAILFQNRPL